MRKLIIFLIAGMLWFSFGFAEEVELNCKNGIMIKHQSKKKIDTEMNYIINLEDYSFLHKDYPNTGKEYFISTTADFVIDGLVLYRFSNNAAQIGGYANKIGELLFVTGHFYTEDIYENTKLKLDKINKQISNYKVEKVLGQESYSVSSLGTTDQELEKFQIVRAVIDKIAGSNPENVDTSLYQCNKLDLK